MFVLSPMAEGENSIRTSIHDTKERVRVSKGALLQSDKRTNSGAIYYWTEEKSESFLDWIGILDTD